MPHIDENSKSSIPEDDSGIQIRTPVCLSQDSATSTTNSRGPTDFKNLKRSPIPGDDDDDADVDTNGSNEPISRKEKSLGRLCKRFLLTMDEESSTGHDVHLESVARNMSVEKRRIYDIVNVMEALEAMRKTNKSYYKWNGLESLPCLMHQLAKEALIEKLPTRILQVERAMCSFTEIGTPQSVPTVGSLTDESSSTSTPSTQNDSFKLSGGSRDRNGKNSLSQLCRRFLMVLLCNPKDKRRVSLDVASTVLIKDADSEGFDPPSRSRCRRLYDIANVLVAMNLIKKVHYLFGTKKIPLFVYCGPEPEENPVAAATSMKIFLAENGMTDAEMEALKPPAAKLRRVSSDNIQNKAGSKFVAPSSSDEPSSSMSLQRSSTMSELHKLSSAFNNPNQALTDCKSYTPSKAKEELDENDKENTAPSIPRSTSKLEFTSNSEPSLKLNSPIPRPLHRQPLGALNFLTGMSWPSFTNNIFPGSSYMQLLNAAQQQRQQQQQNAFLNSENKMLQQLVGLPPPSLPSLPSSAEPANSAGLSELTKLYLRNLCNSQQKF